MLCQWRVRKKGQEANPYEDYREFPSVFCLKINHGGTFTPPPMTRYKGGSDSGSDSEDSDYFVDEENLIEDVDVDMAEFKRHTDPSRMVRM
ncbi:hypothetical protein Tco_0536557 [Tanacetum coccineum]